MQKFLCFRKTSKSRNSKKKGLSKDSDTSLNGATATPCTESKPTQSPNCQKQDLSNESITSSDTSIKGTTAIPHTESKPTQSPKCQKQDLSNDLPTNSDTSIKGATVTPHTESSPTQAENTEGRSELATASLPTDDGTTKFKMESDLYETKGKGLCLIFVNFLPMQNLTLNEADPVLRGYKEDIESLSQLFNDDKFDFDVKTEVKKDMPFRNLSTRQFRSCLSDVQDFLNNDGGAKYDKFVMFVLSHGNEKGICMCKEKSDGRCFEKECGEQCVISQEEIIHSFTHDVIPSLEGVPKCFFFQACRGGGYTQAAVKSEKEPMPDDGDDTTDHSLPSIISKDILVVHASLDMKRCYVHSRDGSWFIEKLIETLQQQCEIKDIYGMLSDVIVKTSKKKEGEFFYCNRNDCEMKTKMGGRECTVSVVGRLKNQEYRPLCVSDNNYSFAHAERLNLSSCEFKGKIETLQFTQTEIPFTDWVPAETLKIFGNSKHFKISGELKKGSTQYKHQHIEIEGDTLEIPYSDVPQCEMAKVEKMARLKHEDLPETSVSPGSLGKCFLYMDGKKYGSGQFTQRNDLWGIYVERYQLPVFTSTLTKQLYLAKLNKPNDAAAVNSNILKKEIEEEMFADMKANFDKKFEEILQSKKKPPTRMDTDEPERLLSESASGQTKRK